MESTLNPFFLAGLFEEEIYLTDRKENPITEYSEPNNETIAEAPVKTEFAFYGKNLNSVLLLTNESRHDWIIPKEKLVIAKILSLFNVEFDEGALVNLANQNAAIDMSELLQYFGVAKIIGFSISADMLPGMARNKFFEYEKARCYLCSDSLSDIAMDKGKKAGLWKNLKLVFD